MIYSNALLTTSFALAPKASSSKHIWRNHWWKLCMNAWLLLHCKNEWCIHLIGPIKHGNYFCHAKFLAKLVSRVITWSIACLLDLSFSQPIKWYVDYFALVTIIPFIIKRLCWEMNFVSHSWVHRLLQRVSSVDGWTVI
jgi:hypothetical protein